MQPYKIVVAYDGTAYAGWQVQKHAISIAGLLQQRFFDAFGRSIKLVGASRTDAGVHAHGQVARFETDMPLDAATLHRVWNQHLPSDILIHQLEPCEHDFSPRYGVQQKTYFYQFFLSLPHPFYARFGYYVPYKLDIEKFKTCLQFFLGTHDFRSFCTGGYTSTIRTIDHLAVCFDDHMAAYRVEIRGRSFLRYMVRRIIGACIKVASSSLSPLVISEALEQQDPRQQLPTAPAQGLILYEITYKS